MNQVKSYTAAPEEQHQQLFGASHIDLLCKEVNVRQQSTISFAAVRKTRRSSINQIKSAYNQVTQTANAVWLNYVASSFLKHINVASNFQQVLVEQLLLIFAI